MELIKKIKQTEEQGREIIEQAKAQAAKQAEQNRQKRLELMAAAERNRKNAIEQSIAKAQTEGLAEIEELKNQAQNSRRQLRESVSGKTAPAVQKVMDYLKG